MNGTRRDPNPTLHPILTVKVYTITRNYHVKIKEFPEDLCYRIG